MSTVLTSFCYRGALYAFPFFLAKCKSLLVNRGPWWFLVYRVAEAHLRIAAQPRRERSEQLPKWTPPFAKCSCIDLKETALFLKNKDPWVLFLQCRPKAYLRQAAQRRCGPTCSRPKVNISRRALRVLEQVYIVPQVCSQYWSNRDPWALN